MRVRTADRNTPHWPSTLTMNADSYEQWLHGVYTRSGKKIYSPMELYWIILQRNQDYSYFLTGASLTFETYNITEYAASVSLPLLHV